MLFLSAYFYCQFFSKFFICVALHIIVLLLYIIIDFFCKALWVYYTHLWILCFRSRCVYYKNYVLFFSFIYLCVDFVLLICYFYLSMFHCLSYSWPSGMVTVITYILYILILLYYSTVILLYYYSTVAQSQPLQWGSADWN